MNKSGMREVIARYYVATNLVHDRTHIGNRIRELKGYWQFIQRLRDDTSLGRRYDGTVDATEKWWEDNTKVIANIPISCLYLEISSLAH